MRSKLNKLWNNKLFLFILFFVWSKYILYKKIGTSYLEYSHIDSDFFPDFLYLLNPLYLDIIILLSIALQNKVSYLVAIALSFLQIIHPESFGNQNYVVSFYVLIWLLINELNSNNSQIFLGRTIVSFIFTGAFIGKLTPGWTSGQHPEQFLNHISDSVNFPYLFVGGEMAVAISFILPFKIGILIPIIIIIGMITSISFQIFDAVGPILGLLLTILVLKFYKQEMLIIFFDKNCGICKKIYNTLNFFNFKYLQLSFVQETDENTGVDQVKAYTYIASKSIEATYYGYDTYCEIISRIPILTPFYPIMKSKLVAQIGHKLYLAVANSRSCKIS